MFLAIKIALFCLLVNFILVGYNFLKRWYTKKFKMTFVGKTVWITGASSGIGEQIAYKMNNRGAKLIISARNEEEVDIYCLERVKKNCSNPDNVEVVVLDQSDIQNTSNTAERVMKEHNNKIDIIVNNSGRTIRSHCLDADFENEKYILRLNLLSQIALTKVVAPAMINRKSGKIVVMNSVQGKIGMPTRTIYAASKFGLCGYFDALRAEISDKGVSVIQLFPGAVKTNVAKNAFLSERGENLGVQEQENDEGYTSSDFADRVVEAIYFNDPEVYYTPPINLFPQAIFQLAKGPIKKQQEESLKEALEKKEEIKS